MSIRSLTGAAVVLASLLAVAAATAGTAPAPVPGQRAALAALRQAVSSGRLDPTSAKADRAEIARAVHLARVLPRARRAPVVVALEQVAALGRRLSAPRALAVFGQLRANDDYFAQHGAPRSGTDITDADGIVYRYFAGRCFEFHPLANFAALNARVAAKDVAGTQRLAAALAARAVYRHAGGVAWEYYFPYGTGRPPWVSGMAQAVAAQAFARAAALVTADSAALLREASFAFRAIPRLLTKVAAGPWIRLYSFRSTPVLNAQLQSVLSLESYAKATGDQVAATLAAQMEQAAAATLSQFDTGYWTDYSLAGEPSSLSYQDYVVRLLQKLSAADPRFAQAAVRFAAYRRQPPAFKLATAPVGGLRFWLSKPASVSISTTAGRTVRLTLDGGWHTFRWSEPQRAGFYPVGVTAVGWAGNRASFEALPIVRVPAVSRQPREARRTPAGGLTPTGTQPLFAVGAGIDDPAQAALAASLGLRLVRLTIPWQAGQTAPDAAIVSSLQSVPPGVGLVVDLSLAGLPADDAERAGLGQFAASLAQQVPALQDLFLTPAPELATTTPYAAAVAAVQAAVQPVRADVAVGPSFDGSTPKPQQTALALGQALALDAVRPGLVDFLPAAAPAAGLWAASDVGALARALATRLGTAPPVLLDGIAMPTTAQASDYATAIGDASCSPGVGGVLLDRLVDDSSPQEPATGLFSATGAPKPAAAAVEQVIGAIARGAVVCPGLAAGVTPTALTFPDRLAGSSAVPVVLGCSRDCLYLVTLDRADGSPVVARRGALAGGAPAQTITLPQRRLSRGRYRLDVRLVSSVDPGAVTRRTSLLLTVG